MGGTARQFNKMYIDYKQSFKKPLSIVASLMPRDFSDEYFVEKFRNLYPNMWDDIEKQYTYWHDKNNTLMKHGKKSRYNFRKPYNFILDCSYHYRIKLHKNNNRSILTQDEIKRIEGSLLEQSANKTQIQHKKTSKFLYYIQEVEPVYTKSFIDKYFNTHDLHERLEII